MAGLEEKNAIPAVAQRDALIHEIQTDGWWEGVPLPMLEQACRNLRDLIKFIDRDRPREKVYTDFEVEMGEGTKIGGLVVKDGNLKNYGLQWEQFIREHWTTSPSTGYGRTNPSQSGLFLIYNRISKSTYDIKKNIILALLSAC